MAVRYSAEYLLHLRNSPLCTRPDNLPPAEEWMGTPSEQIRTQGAKTVNERPRTNDSSLLDQTNRRSSDRHVSRNSSNPDDIVFGPPRMAFSSARGNKVFENDKSSRDTNSQGRPGLRSRGDTDGDRIRDGRPNPLRRRGEGDPDGDGWNMVKPRKSFGAEGAERFHGKMGGNFRDDKRLARDSNNKDDREAARERPGRAFDTFARDRDGIDAEARPRNGLGRNKGDNWRVVTEAGETPLTEKRDRDRTKSWRDRDRDVAEPSEDRNVGKANDRRWGREREQRQEREPEWLDEPAEAREAHTQQDFQKWMEQMKKTTSGPSASNSKPPTETVTGSAKSALPAPAVEAGPDKFFLAFGGGSGTSEAITPGEQKDSASKAKTVGKSSRFTSFFSQPQGDTKPRTESSTSLTGPPANGFPATAGSTTVLPGLGGLFGAAVSVPGGGSGGVTTTAAAPPEEERQAFKQLLAKLQKTSISATPPGPSPFAAPPPANAPDNKKNVLGSPEPFKQFGGPPRDGPLGRPPSQQPQQEILAPRPQQQSARPEQLLQELVGHHQRVSSQGSTTRPESNSARNNSNTEFLMNLMRMAPESQQRSDHGRVPSQPQLGPQIQKHSLMPPYNDREQEFGGRENRNNVRPQPPPGFSLDEQYHNVDREFRQNQPTQILQRPPPPPGLDQMPPTWMAGGAQMPPPQQRGPMLPPPGLTGGLSGLNRNMPMPPMFPPNFPPSGLPPPPDAMGGGMPPRNMPPPPPPGFFTGPPHGFLPPGLGGFNGPPPGPEGFGGPPFEARGMHPSVGNNGRGGNYGRP